MKCEKLDKKSKGIPKEGFKFECETLSMQNYKYCKTVMDVGQFLNLLSFIAARLRCFHSSVTLYKRDCLTEMVSNSIRVKQVKKS